MKTMPYCSTYASGSGAWVMVCAAIRPIQAYALILPIQSWRLICPFGSTKSRAAQLDGCLRKAGHSPLIARLIKYKS